MDAEARKAAIERVKAYIGQIQPLLRLSHWQFIVLDEQPGPADGLASFERLGSRWCAILRFSDRHFGDGLAVQRQTVVHELFHAVLGNLTTAVSAGYNTLDPTSRGWAWERFLHEMELTVDGLALLVAPSMPLPPTDTPKEATDASH